MGTISNRSIDKSSVSLVAKDDLYYREASIKLGDNPQIVSLVNSIKNPKPQIQLKKTRIRTK